jgi:hypothetical protein
VLAQDLDGHVTTEARILGFVHLAHPAGAEAIEDPIVGKRPIDHESSRA